MIVSPAGTDGGAESRPIILFPQPLVIIQAELRLSRLAQPALDLHAHSVPFARSDETLRGRRSWAHPEVVPASHCNRKGAMLEQQSLSANPQAVAGQPAQP